MIKKARGRIVIFSAPSGSGKTTILNTLLRAEPGVTRSISMTTRRPRPGERNGRDYWFVTPERFRRALEKRELLEHARILGQWYGTPRKPVERALDSGHDVLMGVDIQGAAQIRRSGLPATTIFLLPPSLSTLRHRLEARGTETRAQIQARLNLARRELRAMRKYDYAVINDRLTDAIAAVRLIIRAERFRVNCFVDHNGKGC